MALAFQPGRLPAGGKAGISRWQGHQSTLASTQRIHHVPKATYPPERTLTQQVGCLHTAQTRHLTTPPITWSYGMPREHASSSYLAQKFHCFRTMQWGHSGEPWSGPWAPGHLEATFHTMLNGWLIRHSILASGFTQHVNITINQVHDISFWFKLLPASPRPNKI